MVAFEKDVDLFLDKSVLLLEAFPNARFTIKYRKISDDKSLVIARTLDPLSHAIVKFKSDRTIDLGRLMVGSTKLTERFTNKAFPDKVDTEMTQDDSPDPQPETKHPKKKKKKGKK